MSLIPTDEEARDRPCFTNKLGGGILFRMQIEGAAKGDLVAVFVTKGAIKHLKNDEVREPDEDERVVAHARGKGEIDHVARKKFDRRGFERPDEFGGRVVVSIYPGDLD
jgi:hypothetical protein